MVHVRTTGIAGEAGPAAAAGGKLLATQSS
jgi:hypothetical protein